MPGIDIRTKKRLFRKLRPYRPRKLCGAVPELKRSFSNGPLGTICCSITWATDDAQRQPSVVANEHHPSAGQISLDCVKSLQGKRLLPLARDRRGSWRLSCSLGISIHSPSERPSRDPHVTCVHAQHPRHSPCRCAVHFAFVAADTAAVHALLVFAFGSRHRLEAHQSRLATCGGLECASSAVQPAPRCSSAASAGCGLFRGLSGRRQLAGIRVTLGRAQLAASFRRTVNSRGCDPRNRANFWRSRIFLYELGSPQPQI